MSVLLLLLSLESSLESLLSSKLMLLLPLLSLEPESLSELLSLKSLLSLLSLSFELVLSPLLLLSLTLSLELLESLKLLESLLPLKLLSMLLLLLLFLLLLLLLLLAFGATVADASYESLRPPCTFRVSLATPEPKRNGSHVSKVCQCEHSSAKFVTLYTLLCTTLTTSLLLSDTHCACNSPVGSLALSDLLK